MIDHSTTIEGNRTMTAQTEPRWWETHSNIATLAAYMAHTGHDAHEVARAVEKPWNYDNEYAEAAADAT